MASLANFGLFQLCEKKLAVVYALWPKAGHKPFLANIFRKKKLATKHPTPVVEFLLKNEGLKF